MNLHGFEEKEAEDILLAERCRRLARNNPARRKERHEREVRIANKAKSLSYQDDWQMCVFPLAAKIAEESWDISRLWVEDTVFEFVAEWLIDDEDEWQIAHKEEMDDLGEAEKRAMEFDIYYDKLREERDDESA